MERIAWVFFTFPKRVLIVVINGFVDLDSLGILEEAIGIGCDTHSVVKSQEHRFRHPSETNIHLSDAFLSNNNTRRHVWLFRNVNDRWKERPSSFWQTSIKQKIAFPIHHVSFRRWGVCKWYNTAHILHTTATATAAATTTTTTTMRPIASSFITSDSSICLSQRLSGDPRTVVG